MAEDIKVKENKDKKKQKNLLLIAAIIIIALCGIYYFYSNNQIAKSSTNSNTNNNASISSSPQNSDSELTSKKWTWTKTQMSDGKEIVPSADGKFTLTFQTDMRVLATTDCNNGNGSYELGPNNSLTMGPMATTMMFCEGSSETEFYQGLANVGSYKIENGQLWLMLQKDSGTMVFE